EKLLRRANELAEENYQLKKASGDMVLKLLEAAIAVEGVLVVAKAVDDTEPVVLKDLADEVAGQMNPGVVLLGTVHDGKAIVVCKANDTAVAQGAHAGNAVKAAAEAIGGRGGGR